MVLSEMVGSVQTPRRVLGVAVSAGLAFALVAGGCSGSTTNATTGATTPKANQAAPKDEGPPVSGGTLRVGMPAEVDGMNPVQARWSHDGNMIGSSVFDSLLTFDENRKLVPRLATAVTPNATGTEWTIKVRPGVTFHDGSSLDAAVVKKNVDSRKMQPITGSALDPIESVAVVDPLTVVVKMKTPWFGYDYTIAAQGGYMVAAAQIDAPNSLAHAIGTGPFRQVGDFSTGQSIKVERNPNYWGDKPLLDGIVFSFILDENGRTNALKAHDVDMILTQNPAAITTFRDAPGFVQVEDVAGEEKYAMLGMDSPPFTNVHARKALAYATDPKDIAESLGDGVLQPANGPFTAGEKYYNPNSGYPAFDLEKAKAEVEAYKKDTGQTELAFKISTSSGEQDGAVALQGQWRAAGINAEVETSEQLTFLTTMFSGKFQVATFRNFAYVNPDSNFIFWHSSQAKGVGVGSINFGQLKSPELDKALETARANPDDASRAEQYKNLTPILNASVPYIWMVHSDWALAADQKVGGLRVPQKLGFGRQDNKPWWNAIWMKQ